MKTYLNFLLMMFLIASCAPKQQFHQTPPFHILNATQTSWSGGQPGVKGSNITIEINSKNIELDSIFFRNKKVTLDKKVTSTKQTYTAVFVWDTKENEEYYTIVINNNPHVLGLNDAIVSYQKNKTKHYFILKGIKKTDKSIYYE